uniref:Uncharacterized protein n=1 Tax=Romanomermis culicivorax TaxID=13658 RepID=A0A915JFJ8_ROMCU
MFEQTHDCSNMALLKLEEHPTLKGCFVFASQHEDVYFVLQKSGKLRAVNGSLTNQSLNVQDLRCFNYKQRTHQKVSFASFIGIL